jgi:hypothetical protein
MRRRYLLLPMPAATDFAALPDEITAFSCVVAPVAALAAAPSAAHRELS